MRDPQRQNIFGNKFSVSYPDFPSMSRLPRYMIIHQEMGHHDIVELYYQVMSPFMTKAIKTGSPIQITWSNDKTSGTFIGYTTKVSFPTAQMMERYVKVTCTAASFVMKEKKSKIWVNRTASEIVAEIAKTFNFVPKVTSSPVRFSQQSLTGHTYWSKIAELSQRIGYGFHAIGTELHFHPIDTMIDRFMTTIPILSMLDSYTNPQSHYKAQTLDRFDANAGDFIESGGHNRSVKVVSGVDPVTGKYYSTQSSPNAVGKNLRNDTKEPLFSSIESSVVVSSQAMAQSMADGKAHLSRLSVPGSGTAQGDPRISPWNTVEIRGTGSTTDGFWVVKSATHTIHYDGRYRTEFECVTDGIGGNAPSATRPVSAGLAPVRNVSLALTDAQTRPSSYKLLAQQNMISQGSNGFKVLPRRWVGV